MRKGRKNNRNQNQPTNISKRVRNERPKLDYEALELRQLLAGDFVGNLSPDGRWMSIDQNELQAHSADRFINLRNFGLFDLQESNMLPALSAAPLEFTPNSEQNAVTISIPRPDSTLATFKVVESPIMEPGLAAKFPDFKTYRGWGLENPSETVRFDVTALGFRAQVFSPDGNFYIDPYFKGETELYSSYHKQDVVRNPNDRFVCGCGGCGCGGCTTEQLTEKYTDPGVDEPQAFVGNFGTQLRTFRLATAATGEYTGFFGGTVAQGQAAIVTAINRVNQMYERDVAIRLVLVANNSSLVFTNASTDPYTNNNGSTMLGQNQTTVDTVIGNANYDIGHVFSTGGGGIAGLGVVGVTGSKARGVTGQPSPIGDPFYIDYVSHEIGHQFRANHTFNGTNCGGGRVASAAYGLGSDVTIMGYAGICGSDNVANFSDAMFHAKSIDEIRIFITNTIPGVGTVTNTGNSVPTVTTPTGFVIPASTPFELTATGSDPNGNQLLYSWEQYNLGPATTLSAVDNGSSPLFRTWNPTTSPTRVFPRLSNLVTNTVPTSPSGLSVEKLPTANWSAGNPMRFRVIVRDNVSGGGAVAGAEMTTQVVNTGAPFSVTSNNSASSWAGGSSQTLSWNVAGTTGSGINTANVDIWLSTDGGFTYPTQLAAATPNDGSHMITVPNISTSQARFKIKGTNNIFFDINNANITITPTNVVANLTGPSSITEGDVGTSVANFAITLTAASASTITVNYTLDNTGFANPATPGSDYINVNGVATFTPGQTTVNVPVTILGDRFTEGIEQFRMVLSNPVGAQLGTSTLVSSISDDDAFALGRIIDLGTATSPVQVGTSGFTTAAYNSFTGIGWTASTDLAAFNLKTNPLTAVPNDGVHAQSANFRIDVPNGNYQVELIYGWIVNDASISRNLLPLTFREFSVSLQGTNYPLNLEDGLYVTRTYSASTTNGQLNIGLQSGLTLAKLAGILVTSAAPRGAASTADSRLALAPGGMIDSQSKELYSSKLTPDLAKAQVAYRFETKLTDRARATSWTPQQMVVSAPVVRKQLDSKVGLVDKDPRSANLNNARSSFLAKNQTRLLDRWFASIEPSELLN